MTSADQPLVSVVISILNGELYIEEAILSVLNQTYGELELIVINDGSTDKTADVVQSTISRFSNRQITFVSRENRGMCRSLNEGLEISRGKYFAYVGADDIWAPKKLEIQVAELERTGDAAAFSDCLVINSSGEVQNRYGERFPYHGGDIYQDLLWCKFQPASPTNLFRRETLDVVGNFDESHIWEDRDMWIRIAKDNRVVYIDKPLASYRVHGKNGSATNMENIYKYGLQSLDAAVRRDPSLVPIRRSLKAEIDAKQAGAYFETLQMGKARHYAVKALLERPANTGAWRSLLLSLFGAGLVSRIREKRRKNNYSNGLQVDREDHSANN